MKLIQALEIGNECGLKTVGECVCNIHMHALSLFSYDNMCKELAELNQEYDKLCEGIQNAENMNAWQILKVLDIFQNNEAQKDNDCTEKFAYMLSAFQCDFSLARDDGFNLAELNKKIKEGDKTLMEHIELLEELEWNLRNERMKIVKVELEDV